MTVEARTESTRVLEPGARIGRKLEVLRRLGEGGMGTLWVARNLATHAEVAIKVLRDKQSEDDVHTAERFRHEARLGGMLAHRNITRVFDLIEDDDGALVLVMELLHGQTLLDFWEAKRTLSCKEAVEILVPILGALQHAHDHGVVHRDLKPANIFLHIDPDGHTTPKLLDFGIAKMGDSSIKTRAGDVLGTPSYMSPEQVRASKKIDGRSDLFSVGTVLYEIITGESPFRTDSPSATLARVLELEVDPDPRIEPRLWLEIQRALSKQPYARHGSADELADALLEALGGPRRTAPRVKPPGRISEPKLETFAAAVPVVPVEPPEDATLEIALPLGLPRRAAPARLAVYGMAVVLAVAGIVLLRAASRASKAVPVPDGSAATTAIASPSAGPSASEPAWEIPEESPSNPQRPPRAHGPTRPPPRRQGTSPQATPRTPPSASGPPIARTPGF